MTNDIIRMKLDKNKIKYKETNKSFIIPKEIKVSSKAPKWFTEFEERINKRFDAIEKDIKEMKNTPTMKRELDKQNNP